MLIPPSIRLGESLSRALIASLMTLGWIPNQAKAQDMDALVGEVPA